MAEAATVESVDLDSVDLMDAAWFADGPPHELFARMRSEAPVRRMSDIELAGEVKRFESSWTNALRSLPVSFSPGKPEAG